MNKFINFMIIFEILLIATCIGFAIYNVIIGEFGSFILNIILATINCLTLVVFLALKD